MAGLKGGKKNRQQIEASLKSAVEGLTPHVLERLDLSAPQTMEGRDRPVFFIRHRIIGTLAAACLGMIVLAGGSYTYQNSRVDSIIGIDVNPSVELSVNRKNKVLDAKPLNEDADRIMADMELEGVDLNIAVNAVIGSMVTHGYLDDLDNAILVTVSNDSIKKATSLRSAVVGDIQSALEEKQVKAVVYDQQVIEEDEVKELAGEYGISYGKAYFLKELIAQNASLTMEDMEKLAPLTMEEIAKEIAERSYAVGGQTTVTEETTASHTTLPETTADTSASEEGTEPPAPSEETSESESGAGTEAQTQTESQTLASQTESQTVPDTAPSEETSSEQETSSGEKIKIDYVDYENGMVSVHFKTKVKWKNPTVSIKDEDGTTYSAKVEDTGSDYCEISVAGLEGGTEYTFVLGGISPKIGRQTTVKGVFETPVIGEGSPDPEESEEETKEEESQETTEAKQAGESGNSGETESVQEREIESSMEQTEPSSEQESAEERREEPSAQESSA